MTYNDQIVIQNVQVAYTQQKFRLGAMYRGQNSDWETVGAVPDQQQQ